MDSIGIGIDTEKLKPVDTLIGYLEWHLHFPQVVFIEPPYVDMQAVPHFPGCSENLQEQDIVWDIFALMESVKRPGRHYVFTCSCGTALDADLYQSIQVRHPDADTVFWDFDVQALGAALEERYSEYEHGFIRLVFARPAYETAIHGLFNALRSAGSTPLDISSLTDTRGLACLRREYPQMSLIQVEEMNPNSQGLALERLLAMNGLPDGVYEHV